MPSHHPARKLNSNAKNKSILHCLVNMDFRFIFSVHKLVKYSCLSHCLEMEENCLNQNLNLNQRKELEGRMAEVLKENINVLSTELQEILLDDMVTAFQNRIKVLIRAQEKRSY